MAVTGIGVPVSSSAGVTTTAPPSTGNGLEVSEVVVCAIESTSAVSSCLVTTGIVLGIDAVDSPLLQAASVRQPTAVPPRIKLTLMLMCLPSFRGADRRTRDRRVQIRKGRQI